MARGLRKALVQLAGARRQALHRHQARLRRAVHQALAHALTAQEQTLLAAGALVDLRHQTGERYRARLALVSLRSGGKTEYWFSVRVPGQWRRLLLGRPLLAIVDKSPAEDLRSSGQLVMEASMIIGRQTMRLLSMRSVAAR